MEAQLHVTSVLTCNSEERTHLSWVNFCWAALQPDRPGWFYCPVFGVPVSEVSEASHVSRSISISTSPIWLWPQPASRGARPTRCFCFSSVDGGWTMRSPRWTAMLAGWLANTLSDWIHTKSTLFTPTLIDKRQITAWNKYYTYWKVAGRLDLLCSCFFKSKPVFLSFCDSLLRFQTQENPTA